MRLGVLVVSAILFVRAGFAQTSEETLKSAIAAIRYPPLCEAAQIHGDVRVTIDSGAVTSVSGHPLLVQNLPENAKSLASILGKADLDVTYHFVFADTDGSAPMSTLVMRGSAFGRALLRTFGRKTLKVVVEYQCGIGVVPPNDVTVGDGSIDVWIYGKERCLETSVS